MLLAATVVSQAIAGPGVAAQELAPVVASADFDADGDVDSDDLAQWEGDYGPGGNSDADGDGASTGLDFLAWQRQFTGSLANLFSDDFSTDTTSNYTTVQTGLGTNPPDASFLYDATGQRAQVASADNAGLKFSQNVVAIESGTFSIDFNPTEKYPFGGYLWVRLVQDANNYYEIENTDGYGAGEIRKFVGGNTTPVETASFTAEYSQGNNYTISIDFSPTNTTVTAFDETLTLNTNTASINVGSFEVEAIQQTAYFDDISLDSASGTPDVTAPTAPTGLSATPFGNQMDLSWTASTDDVGVVGYTIYRDTVQIATNVATTTYSDTGLAAGTYSYTVAAFDVAGNTSAQSSPTSGTIQPVTGNTYYISPTGSDTTGNGTLASPWGSLKKAHDNLSPGDTVYARGGTYENSAGQDMQGARWTASGIPGSPITIAAYPGETPVFHRASGGQHFLILRVVDSAPRGVGIQYVTIDGLTIDGYQNAVAMRGCRSFINNTTWSYADCAAEEGHPDPQYRHVDNIIIRNNHIINSTEHGIYPGAQVRNLEIYNNRIENPGGHGIHLFHETGVIGGEIYNNVVSGGKVGIGVYTEANGVNVYNNTIYNQTVAGLRFGDVIDVVVENNVVLENTAPAIFSTSGIGELADISFDHNLYYRTNSGPIATWGGTNYQDLAAWQGIIGPDDDNSEEANPLFVNAAAADFHLQSGSPAIDTGASTHAPSVDIDGNSRPIDGDGAGGAQFDKGAYEFVPSPLLAAQGETFQGNGTPINATALAPIVEEATRRWEAAGFDTAVLEDADVAVGSLGGDQLAARFGNHITIDTDAAGYGWFVDRTPGRDNEYDSGTATRGVASRRMDLLTVVSHELGHVLGLPHDADGATATVMHDTLDVGQRRTAHDQPGKVSQTSKGEHFDAALATFGGRDGLPTGRQHSASARFVPEALDVLAQGFALDRRRQRDLPVGRFSRDHSHDLEQIERDQKEVLDDLFADFEEVLASQL